MNSYFEKRIKSSFAAVLLTLITCTITACDPPVIPSKLDAPEFVVVGEASRSVSSAPFKYLRENGVPAFSNGSRRKKIIVKLGLEGKARDLLLPKAFEGVVIYEKSEQYLWGTERISPEMISELGERKGGAAQ